MRKTTRPRTRERAWRRRRWEVPCELEVDIVKLGCREQHWDELIEDMWSSTHPSHDTQGIQVGRFQCSKSLCVYLSTRVQLPVVIVCGGQRTALGIGSDTFCLSRVSCCLYLPHTSSQLSLPGSV